MTPDAGTDRQAPRDPLDAVIEGIRGSAPSEGRQLVDIDGIGGSGKTTFAAALADRITERPVIVLHVDDFFNPPTTRHARGRYSPEGFWLDTYDYDALTFNALEPLQRGDRLYRTSSAPKPEGTSAWAPENALVLVEGTFLHRDRLRHFWDFSIYLHVPFAVAADRMTTRGTVSGEADDPLVQRYQGAQQRYFEAARPWERASVVLDLSDPDRVITISATAPM